LLTEFIRRWRVDAPSSVQATVSVTDSPFGVFVGARRCVPTAATPKWWRVERWPWLRGVLKKGAPSWLALWYLFTDAEQPCNWQDISDRNTDQVIVRGGDVVVVTFVVP
jgi:hypothetical protein